MPSSKPVNINNRKNTVNRDSVRSMNGVSHSPSLIFREQGLASSLQVEFGKLLGRSSHSTRLSIAQTAEIDGEGLCSAHDHLDCNETTEKDGYQHEHDEPLDTGEKSPLLLCSEDENMELGLGIIEDHKSSFMHSTFNAINVLIGIGILSLPLSLKLGGWLIGITMLILSAIITSYTALVLKKCIDSDESIHSYADIGFAAFGQKGRIFVMLVFTVEIFTAAVALLILMADSLHALVPSLSLVYWKIIAFGIATPMTWIPSLRFISYTSLLGIFSILFLILAMAINGLWYPQSLILHPQETHIFPRSWLTLPSIIGLSMAGFAGHAIFPSIYQDMRRKKQYKSVVGLSYLSTTFIYLLFASLGYLMFGDQVADEVTKNLKADPLRFPVPYLNSLAVFFIVMNPLSKYPLTMIPIAYQGRDNSFRSIILNVLSKTAISALCLLCALTFPAFDKIMGLMGSLFSLKVSVTCPCACYLKLFHKDMSAVSKAVNWVLVVTGVMLSIIGTVWTFLPKSYVEH